MPGHLPHPADAARPHASKNPWGFARWHSTGPDAGSQTARVSAGPSYTKGCLPVPQDAPGVPGFLDGLVKCMRCFFSWVDYAVNIQNCACAGFWIIAQLPRTPEIPGTQQPVRDRSTHVIRIIMHKN